MRLPRKDKYDEKAIKRKTKKVEKDAIRELKKDNVAIQQQREQERSWKRGSNKKKTFTVGMGGSLKDEV